MYDLKRIIGNKFHPILQHDIHEFLAYIMGALQDETTPKDRIAFDGSDMKKTFSEIEQAYYKSHPSIID